MIVRQYKITLSTGSVYEKGDKEASSFEGHSWGQPRCTHLASTPSQAGLAGSVISTLG